MVRKILFTASTYSHIHHFHLPYLRHFHEEGWTVHVACAHPPERIPWAHEGFHLPFEKRMHSPSNFRAVHILRQKLAAEGYDLITTHTSLAAFFTRLAVKGLKNSPPVVNMVHGYLFDDATGFLKKQLLLGAERLTASRTDLLLTMNRWDTEAAKRWKLGRQIVEIPGIGVDFSGLEPKGRTACERLREEWGIPADAFVLFYAAEFSRRKSQETLIRAMERLPREAVLVLAGDGALLEECRTLARELGVEGRVVFPGYVREVGLWYETAGLALSASRSEGLPFNIMEAMYCGLPVAASAVKGHEDLIRPEETGLLFPYGDRDACAAQVARLMDDPALRARLGQNARAYVQQYSLSRVFPIVTALYHTQVREPAGTPQR